MFVYCRRSCLYDESSDLSWPFQELEGLDHGDIRETAYEILFTACRSSPGFGGRSAITFYSKHDGNSDGKSPGVTQTSKMKLALGLKMMRSSLSQRVMVSTTASTPASPVTERSPRSRSVPRRAMTMAEVMRLQMGVSEQSDSRLRKTLVRTLVGQVRQHAQTFFLSCTFKRVLLFLLFALSSWSDILTYTAFDCLH